MSRIIWREELRNCCWILQSVSQSVTRHNLQLMRCSRKTHAVEMSLPKQPSRWPNNGLPIPINYATMHGVTDQLPKNLFKWIRALLNWLITFRATNGYTVKTYQLFLSWPFVYWLTDRCVIIKSPSISGNCTLNEGNLRHFRFSRLKFQTTSSKSLESFQYTYVELV